MDTHPNLDSRRFSWHKILYEQCAHLSHLALASFGEGRVVKSDTVGAGSRLGKSAMLPVPERRVSTVSRPGTSWLL